MEKNNVQKYGQPLETLNQKIVREHSVAKLAAGKKGKKDKKGKGKGKDKGASKNNVNAQDLSIFDETTKFLILDIFDSVTVNASKRIDADINRLFNSFATTVKMKTDGLLDTYKKEEEKIASDEAKAKELKDKEKKTDVKEKKGKKGK